MDEPNFGNEEWGDGMASFGAAPDVTESWGVDMNDYGTGMGLQGSEDVGDVDCSCLGDVLGALLNGDE